MSELGILPSPIPFGKYYLLERVNIGGMAEIFKAKAFGVEGFERLLAVKRILSSIAEDESFINMFIDEAKIAGQLNHPNIAQVFDLGKVDESYFIALEYIAGKDLKTLFERACRIDEPVHIPRICYLLMKTCEGLGHAHHKKDANGREINIVHRDVSPQNVLVSYEGECKIIDFGIAKAQGKTSQTQVGIIKGKFSYMSPEQVRGLSIDRRSDLFSLGIILYELLTLERLFLGDSDFDTLEKIRKVEISPPSLYNPKIPKDLEDIVLKALAKSPDDRYQSAYELADALEAFIRSAGYYYTNKDLAAYMKDAFAADIEFEDKKSEYYRSLNLQPPGFAPDEATALATSEAEGLSWSDDESETQIFAREKQDEASESIIEPIVDDDIIFRGAFEEEELERTGPIAISGRAVVSEFEVDDDPPTVEFSREQVARNLERLEEEAPPPQRPEEGVPLPPARVERLRAIEARAPLRRTAPLPATAPARSLTTPAVALIVVALGVGALIAFWPSNSTVAVRTEPAQVTIAVDGQRVFTGPTPHSIEVDPGLHTIEISADGYQPAQLTREFKRRRTHEFTPTLAAIKAPTFPQLTVKTDPSEAVLEVDGRTFEGSSPKKIHTLEPGSYSLTARRTGYAPQTRAIELAGQDSTISFDLEPLQIDLRVETDPAGAVVSVTERGAEKPLASKRAPAAFRSLDASKRYLIAAERDGFERAEETIEPSDEPARSIALRLDAKPKRARAAEGAIASRRNERERKRRARDRAEARSAEPLIAAEPPAPVAPAAAQEAGGVGTLTIGSKPAARIFIDGKDTGKYTPLANYKLPAGKHTVELVNEEFDLRRTYYPTIEPGKKHRIIHKPK